MTGSPSISFSDVHLQDASFFTEVPMFDFPVDAIIKALGQTFDFAVDANLRGNNEFSADALLKAEGATGGNRIDLANLIAYYTCDENSNIGINSPRGNPAYGNWSYGQAFQKTPLAFLGGQGGFAKEGTTSSVTNTLNGSYANFGFNLTQDFTINFWIKTSSTSFTIMNSRSTSGPVNGVAHTYQGIVQLESSSNSLATARTVMRTFPSDNQYHMVTIMYNNATNQGEMVVDGDTRTLHNTIFGSGGGIDGSGAKFFSQIGFFGLVGELDEVTLWNRILSDAEIAILLSGSPPSPLTAGQNKFFAVDAVLSDTNQVDFDVDALIQSMPSIMFGVDAIVLGTFAQEFSVDGRLAVRNEFSVDAILSTQKLNDFDVDGFVKAFAQTFEFSVDALTFKRSALFLIDALLRGLKTHDFEVDGFLRDSLVAEFSADALIESMPSTMFMLDAFLKAEGQSHDFDVDAIVVARNQFDFTVDGSIEKINLLEFTVDAGLTGMVDFDFTVDAIIDQVEGIIDVQVVKFETPPQPKVFFEVDARVAAFQQFFFSVDAIVTLGKTHNFEVDAIVKKLGATNTFSVDAFIDKFSRLVHTSLIRDNLKVISVIRRRST